MSVSRAGTGAGPAFPSPISNSPTSELAARLMGLLSKCGISTTVTPFEKEIHTCDGVAEATGLPLDQIGKAMVVYAGKRIIIGLIPGSSQLDMQALRESVGEKKSYFPNTDQLREKTGLTVGAVTPLICLERRDIQLIIDARLLGHRVINISTGDLHFGISVNPKELSETLNAQEATITR